MGDTFLPTQEFCQGLCESHFSISAMWQVITHDANLGQVHFRAREALLATKAFVGTETLKAIPDFCCLGRLRSNNALSSKALECGMQKVNLVWACEKDVHSGKPMKLRLVLISPHHGP